jgi:hypothetical protein
MTILRDRLVISRISNDLSDFPILGVRSIYSLLNMISDPRHELLIAQKSLVEPRGECIEAQGPAMPIMVFEHDPVASDSDRDASATSSSVSPDSPRVQLIFLPSPTSPHGGGGDPPADWTFGHR